MNFELELSKGNFTIPQCEKCSKIVWPPAENCSSCFGKTSLKTGEFEGKIIEFSMKENDYFGMIEFEDSIRIIAKILGQPEIGKNVKMSKCGILDGSYFFVVN